MTRLSRFVYLSFEEVLSWSTNLVSCAWAVWLLARKALIFHLIGIADGTAKPGPVGLDAAELAAAWCDYLESHAPRILKVFRFHRTMRAIPRGHALPGTADGANRLC